MPGRMVGAILLVFWGAVSSTYSQETGTGPTLVALAITEGEQETSIQILTEGGDLDFQCLRNFREGRPGLVMRFPGAASRLETLYPVSGERLQSVEVTSRTEEGTPGVEIHFHLSGDTFWGVEKSAHRLRLAFRKDPQSIAGNLDTEYRVGPGDALDINVYGHPDLNRISEVGGDGFINLPLLGEVSVRNKTVEEIEDELRSRLARDFLVDPQVSVDVETYQSQWVSVVGEVADPDRYFLRGVTTLIEVLADAGGLTDQAGSEILVSRKASDGNPHQKRIQIKVRKDLLFTAMEPEDNIVLMSGDIINVLPVDHFFIRGEVGSPGSYPLERGTTLSKAISIAGGLGEYANRKKVELLREVDGEQLRIVVNLKAIESRKQEDIFLLPDDIILVPRRFL